MSRYANRKALPLCVIQAAQRGDAEAIDRVLRYNEPYINKLCLTTLYDETGRSHICVDNYMKRCLEIKLIQAIVAVN